MGIEKTHLVKYSTALKMLDDKNVDYSKNQTCDEIAHLIYQNRESIFENYVVVKDSTVFDENEFVKNHW